MFCKSNVTRKPSKLCSFDGVLKKYNFSCGCFSLKLGNAVYFQKLFIEMRCEIDIHLKWFCGISKPKKTMVIASSI